MAIPAAIWNAEPHHKEIWKSAGPCVKCHTKPRDAMCPRCLEPMCASCLNAHISGIDHAYDRHIEKMALGKINWDNCTTQECDEARLLQLEWDSDGTSLKTSAALCLNTIKTNW